jgi:hypothetical protein
MSDKYVDGYKEINANVRKPQTIQVFDDNNGGFGLVPGAVQDYIAVENFGNGVINRTKLTCTALPISISDDAGVAQYGGVQVYDFPVGLLCTLGCVINGDLTLPAPFIDAFDGDVALGSATATTGATLTGTEADILQSTALTQASSKVANCDAVTIATALTESGARWFDGTATAKDLFLNFVVDDNAAHTAETGHFTGTIEFLWANVGQN